MTPVRACDCLEAGDECNRAEAACERSHRQLESLLNLLGMILESTVDGIVALDPDGRIIRFNHQFVSLFNISDDVLAFWSHEQVMAVVLAQVRDPDAFRSTLGRICAQPEMAFDESFECVDGRIVEWRAPPQGTMWAGVQRVISFVEVTERVRAQEALLREKAAQQVLIRQLEETRRELVQAEKMASISELSAGVAHEINNPIAFVNSNLKTLFGYLRDLFELIETYERAERALPGDSLVRAEIAELRQRMDLAYLRHDAPDLLQESFDGIRRVKEIVQDLSESSQANDRGWKYADLSRGLDCTLSFLSSGFGEAIRIVREYGEMPEVQCLPSQLNLAFMKLLINAAEAIDGAGVISVRAGEGGERAWVEIADTGRGISPEDLPRVFDPFFSTKPVGQGRGLGLSQVYNIVSNHHGRIEVWSEPGKGSRFRIELPMRQPAHSRPREAMP